MATPFIWLYYTMILEVQHYNIVPGNKQFLKERCVPCSQRWGCLYKWCTTQVCFLTNCFIFLTLLSVKEWSALRWLLARYASQSLKRLVGIWHGSHAQPRHEQNQFWVGIRAYKCCWGKELGLWMRWKTCASRKCLQLSSGFISCPPSFCFISSSFVSLSKSSACAELNW